MIKRGLLAMALAALLVACAGSSTGEESDIPVQDAVLVSQGEALYQANCATCHGAALRGTDQGPSHLSIVYEPSHHGDQAFAFAVKFGVQQHHWSFGPMKPVEGLDDEEIEAIVAFVREEQRLHGFEPYPPD
jgi:mono/diheme cytochrome c family protein